MRNLVTAQVLLNDRFSGDIDVMRDAVHRAKVGGFSHLGLLPIFYIDHMLKILEAHANVLSIGGLDVAELYLKSSAVRGVHNGLVVTSTEVKNWLTILGEI